SILKNDSNLYNKLELSVLYNYKLLYNKSIKLIHKLLSMYPNNIVLLTLYSNILIKLNKYYQALFYVNKILLLTNNKYDEALYLYCLIYFILNHYKLSFKKFKKLLSINNKHSQAHRLYAQLLYELFKQNYNNNGTNNIDVSADINTNNI